MTKAIMGKRLAWRCWIQGNVLLYCQVSKNPIKARGSADLVLRKNAIWQEDLAIGRACFIQKTMLIELLMFNKISGNSGLHSRNTRRFVEGNASFL